MASLKSCLLSSLRPKVFVRKLPLQTPFPRVFTNTTKTGMLSANTETLVPTATMSLIPASHNMPSFQDRVHSVHRTSGTPFDALLNALAESLTTARPPHLPTLTGLLRAYNSDASQWSKYAYQNPVKQYTRNLVMEEPKIFNLLILVWTPGKRSPVHDHASSHCLMKMLKGTLRETRYEMPVEAEGVRDEGLRVIQQKDFGEGKVAYISDRLGLHEICNPSETEYAVSLHLYTPPNAAMYGCHVFDTATGKSTFVPPGGYDSVRGIVSKKG